MPQQQQLVDQEIQAGDFLELNDLLEPLEEEVPIPLFADGSDLTLSLGLNIGVPPGEAHPDSSVFGGPPPQNLEELLASLVILDQHPEFQANFDLNLPIPELAGVAEAHVLEQTALQPHNDNLLHDCNNLLQFNRKMPLQICCK